MSNTKTQAELESLFDSATFESNIVGNDAPYNAHKLTHSGPYVLSQNVTVIERDALVILERVTNANFKNEYAYAELDAGQAAEVTAIDFDPYDDAGYMLTLISFAESIFGETENY